MSAAADERGRLLYFTGRDEPGSLMIDSTTNRILQILERDARAATADIAAMVRTGEEGVLAFIDVRVSPAREVGFDDVAARIYRYPEVLAVYLVSGGYDLQVVVRGPSLRDLAMFVAEKLATIDR